MRFMVEGRKIAGRLRPAIWRMSNKTGSTRAAKVGSRLKTRCTGCVQIAVLLLSTAPAVSAEDYRVEVDSSLLSPEKAKEFLALFPGNLKKLKAKNAKSKPKATAVIEVWGDKDAPNSLHHYCGESPAVKTFGVPYGGLALEFPRNGKFGSRKEIVAAVNKCIDSFVSNLSSAHQSSAKRTRLYRDGSEVARLYLIRYEVATRLYFKRPGIGQ